MPKLLIATGNKGKLREIQALLKDLAVELVLPLDLGLRLEVVEDGKTYAENAERKARAFAEATGLVSLADDSGLEVDALNGLPGLHSARFSAVPGATDADRRHHLLDQLNGHSRPWRARFVCTIALATPAGRVSFAEGECPGEVIPEERGSQGFGYDPIFYIPELGCTMAELSMEAKNRVSHRSRAILAARPAIQQVLDL